MTEIDFLRIKLQDSEKAFDKLHKRHISLLKKQGKLERENQKLKELVLFYLDVATGEFSSHYHKDMEEMCKLIFCCSHQKAEEKYGKYKDELDIREHYKGDDV